jgi:cytochrome P450 family 110
MLPTESPLPAGLQTIRMIVNPIAFLDHCQHQFGDRFTLRVLGFRSPPVAFLSDPEAIAAVFGRYGEQLELGKVTHVFRPLVGAQSLIMQQGDRHQRQRQLLMPAFHRDRLHQQGETICQLVHQRMATWQVGQAIPIRQEMAEISLRVILEVVFGLVPGDRYDRLQKLLSRLLDAITDPLYSVQFFLPLLQVNLGRWSPWGRFLARMAEIDALIAAEIHDRRRVSTHDRSDILSMLLNARDDQGQCLEDAELRDQLMTLLLLGHETTASALAWAFYWVHQDPDVLVRLRSEIQDVVLDPVGLSEQPYLTAVCKESLRAYPIALMRFLQQKFSPTVYFPFGGGSRSCVGMALSMFEMKLVLGTVLQSFMFRSNLMAEVAPVRRGITFVPPERFRLTVI